MSAYVQTALAPGDTITVTHPDARAEGVVAAEYSGIAATNRVQTTGSATGSGQPTVTVVASEADQLVYGAVGSANNRSHFETPGWTSVSHQAVSCGGAPGNADNIGAYQLSSGAGAHTYNPVSSSNRDHWAAGAVVYRTSDTIAPSSPAIDSSPPSPGNDVTGRAGTSGEPGRALRCRLTRGATVVSDWASCASPHTYGPLWRARRQLQLLGPPD